MNNCRKSLLRKRISRFYPRPHFRQKPENRQNRKICSFPYIRQPKPIFRMRSTPCGLPDGLRQEGLKPNLPTPKPIAARKRCCWGATPRMKAVPSERPWQTSSRQPASDRERKPNNTTFLSSKFPAQILPDRGPRPSGKRSTLASSPSSGKRSPRGGKACDVYSLVSWSP